MIIGVAGKARVGKDTFGSYVVEEFKNRYNRVFKQTAFAHVLKLMCQEHFGLTHEQLWGSEKEKMTLYPKPGKTVVSSNPDDYWTPREIMQELGGFYRSIDYDFWVKRLYKEMSDAEDFIITDVRHVNEANSVMYHNGFLIKIERPESEQIHNMSHESETALDNYPVENYSIVIDNSGTLADLRNVAAAVVGAIVKFEELKEKGGVYNE